MSSTSGLHGNVGQANYAAAKAAISGFTKTIAKWGPYGVHKGTISFGLIHTRCVYSLSSNLYTSFLQSHDINVMTH